MAGPNMDQFEAYFQRADLDRDGRITGVEAVGFFKASNLPQPVLAQIWMYADQNKTGFLGRQEFYNALKLVTVAQSKKQLTPELVKAALYGPASTKIPPPQINLAALPVPPPQSNIRPGPGPGALAPPQSNIRPGPVTPAPVSPLANAGPTIPPPQQTQLVRPPRPTPPPNQMTPRGGNMAAPLPPTTTGLVGPGSQPVQTKPNDTSQVAVPKELKANGSPLSEELFSGSSTMTSSSLSSVSSQPTAPRPVGPPQPGGKPGPPPLPNQQASPNEWPKMNQSDVQKYSKVFYQVDSDKDGKISGEQARNLFLSWKLPREILKQVWDLSDQDNDSMLSLKEFCIALYLMERSREGRVLPSILPIHVIMDETLFSNSSGPTIPYTNTPVRPPMPGVQPPMPGVQQPKGGGSRPPVPPGGGRKPPRAPHQFDEPTPPTQPQKPKVPVLEKELMEQLSEQEQKALNLKFQEASDAEKKVAELEKEILDAKEKIQFYHTKMQELILYKSRCDNRLNEITARVSSDKKEAELLAKKYEEKYKQAGDVASKLSIEEATFRDIQDKKMELYRAIVKLDQEGSAEKIEEHASKIQLDLEGQVKALNERCKTYGLRGKPTSLLELPFGWQLGVLEGAADWDEDWDKLEDEGFTIVKELTLDVQNVVAPPKQKTSIRDKAPSTYATKLNNESESQKSPKDTEEKIPEEEEEEERAKSPPLSPARSPSNSRKDASFDGSPRKTEHEEDTKSVLSGDNNEPVWGKIDSPFDTDSAWDFKDEDRENSLFGTNEWGNLNPIKTGTKPSPGPGPSFDSVPSTPNTFINQGGSFFDSVPSTPNNNNFTYSKQGGLFFDSVPSTPLYNSTNSPTASNSMFDRPSPFSFPDSVPGTPMTYSGNSPKEGLGPFGGSGSGSAFSRFDSFNMSDTGPFDSSAFSRFDSMRSTTRDSEYDTGFNSTREFSRFDSFRSTADSEFNNNYNNNNNNKELARFDSIRSSTGDTDLGYGFPSFDDNDPFGTSDPFKTSETPKRDSGNDWKAF